MKAYLIRHAKAVKRSEWQGPDPRRPLTAAGERQATGIAALLEGAPVARILSSPHRRCRDTLEPLAAARGLEVALDERLAEGGSPRKALELLRALGEEPAVVCSHGDVIASLIGELEDQGLQVEGPFGCQKGSIWVLEGPGGTPSRASYVAPREGRLGPSPPRVRRRVLYKGGPAEARQGRPVRLAVLDLGSTSFHLLVSEVEADGSQRRVVRERLMLRLGALIASGSRIPEYVCDRAVATAEQLRRVAEQARAERLLPVATAALRDAENGRELADRIGHALGVPVRILDGAEEARLIFAAFRRCVAPGPDPTLGIDLGGGSLELAIGDERDVHWETTVRIGVARLHGEIVRADPMADAEVAAIRARVRERLLPHLDTIARHAPRRCVATGGTVAALARRIEARREADPPASPDPHFIATAELADLVAELAPSTHEERLAMAGLQRRRADLLPTGAVILETLAGAFGLDGLIVSGWGLREGVMLEALGLAESGRLAS